MLKELRITNLILVESAIIPFKEGFNVLSGETGSGKSAIMNALNLIIGERADSGCIRKGCDKCVVEALFDLSQSPRMNPLLEQAGIDHEEGDDLIVRREIYAAGKSRAFVNHQPSQLGLLRQIGEQLLEIAGQHANQKLMEADKQRELLDIYGGLKDEATAFSKSWEKENTLKNTLQEWISNEAKRLREIEVCRMELEELTEANVKEGEDESLFQEYSLLASAEERASKVQELNQGMSGERNAILVLMNRLKNSFEQLVRIDPSIAEQAKAFDNAFLELQEVSYSLRSYAAKVEYHPEKLKEMNERLGLINRLKRKYGATVTAIQEYMDKTRERLNHLENADQQIEELRAELAELSEKNNALAAALTGKRAKTAQTLAKKLALQLKALNMPKVECLIAVEPQARSRKGDDHIEFYLVPNVGEKQIPIRDCASGGELSRVMLAMQALLAGKEDTPTLVFDEIDANIGGETAAIVGQKLNEIGEKHQVLCITHFPQVAKQAAHHLQISKKERDGRTVTVVKLLSEETRGVELERMAGGI